MKQMNWLELDDNRISSVGPLSNMEVLELLYIENNRVTELASLTKLTALKELRGQGNNIPNEQSTLLIKALPNCRIKAGVFSTIPMRRRSTNPKDK